MEVEEINPSSTGEGSSSEPKTKDPLPIPMFYFDDALVCDSKSKSSGGGTSKRRGSTPGNQGRKDSSSSTGSNSSLLARLAAETEGIDVDDAMPIDEPQASSNSDTNVSSGSKSDDNPPKMYYVGSQVNKFLGLNRGALYSKHPQLFSRAATLEEKRYLKMIGVIGSANMVKVTLVFAVEVHTLLRESFPELWEQFATDNLENDDTLSQYAFSSTNQCPQIPTMNQSSTFENKRRLRGSRSGSSSSSSAATRSRSMGDSLGVPLSPRRSRSASRSRSSNMEFAAFRNSVTKKSKQLAKDDLDSLDKNGVESSLTLSPGSPSRKRTRSTPASRLGTVPEEAAIVVSDESLTFTSDLYNTSRTSSAASRQSNDLFDEITFNMDREFEIDAESLSSPKRSRHSNEYKSEELELALNEPSILDKFMQDMAESVSTLKEELDNLETYQNRKGITSDNDVEDLSDNIDSLRNRVDNLKHMVQIDTDTESDYSQ